MPMASSSLSLIVGLGNPGAQYAATRHNVGYWFIEKVAEHYHAVWRLENKFQGHVCQIKLDHHVCWLLRPNTFMNHSGQSVAALAHFYKIPPELILVCHDELSFSAGVIRLKEGGGHAGHNGLRDIIARLHSSEFKRLRIGINHPGERSQVVNYVLNKPSQQDQSLITEAISQAIAVLPDLVAGDFQKAFRFLHN